MFSRETVTQADIARCVREAFAGGELNGPWAGEDPVQIAIPATSWGALGCTTVPLNSVLNWLNRDCGYFDPVAMGM